MRVKILIFIALVIFTSCNNGGSDNTERSIIKIKKEAVSIAEDYVKEQLKDSRTAINSLGIIVIENNQKRFVIDQRDVFTGLIDEDEKTDAIITITSYNGQDYNMTEHLIMISTEGKLLLIRSFEKDMKILQLKDRIITAEIHTKPRTSPLYSCASCKAIVTYKYSSGDLIKTE